MQLTVTQRDCHVPKLNNLTMTGPPSELLESTTIDDHLTGTFTSTIGLDHLDDIKMESGQPKIELVDLVTSLRNNMLHFSRMGTLLKGTSKNFHMSKTS